ncbi:hypothetical protein EV424DRAFT_1124360 [Suillus variegatus]|nr:hypothetical protein EV424DRAFT_1124360 [Suillus variegatus]
MAATYPIAVPSLADMFPELPQIPVVTNCRIDESKAAGDPIDEDAAHSAEQTVHVLQALRRTVPELTDAHIEGAKNRAHVLRAIHASRAVGPGDILATLNDIRGNLDDIRRNLDNMQRNSTETLEQIQAIMQRNQAMIANIRLARQNHMVPRDRDNYTPLQKTTSGHGRNLAVQASRQEHFNQIPPSATIQVAEVGTCPPFWNPIVDQYTMRTIFQLIIFYNDDFDIQPADNVEVRKYKFRRWLCS